MIKILEKINNTPIKIKLSSKSFSRIYTFKDVCIIIYDDFILFNNTKIVYSVTQATKQDNTLLLSDGTTLYILDFNLFTITNKPGCINNEKNNDSINQKKLLDSGISIDDNIIEYKKITSENTVKYCDIEFENTTEVFYYSCVVQDKYIILVNDKSSTISVFDDELEEILNEDFFVLCDDQGNPLYVRGLDSNEYMVTQIDCKGNIIYYKYKDYQNKEFKFKKFIGSLSNNIFKDVTDEIENHSDVHNLCVSDANKKDNTVKDVIDNITIKEDDTIKDVIDSITIKEDDILKDVIDNTTIKEDDTLKDIIDNTSIKEDNTVSTEQQLYDEDSLLENFPKIESNPSDVESNLSNFKLNTSDVKLNLNDTEQKDFINNKTMLSNMAVISETNVPEENLNNKNLSSMVHSFLTKASQNVDRENAVNIFDTIKNNQNVIDTNKKETGENITVFDNTVCTKDSNTNNSVNKNIISSFEMGDKEKESDVFSFNTFSKTNIFSEKKSSDVSEKNVSSYSKDLEVSKQDVNNKSSEMDFPVFNKSNTMDVDKKSEKINVNLKDEAASKMVDLFNKNIINNDKKYENFISDDEQKIKSNKDLLEASTEKIICNIKNIKVNKFNISEYRIPKFNLDTELGTLYNNIIKLENLDNLQTDMKDKLFYMINVLQLDNSVDYEYIKNSIKYFDTKINAKSRINMPFVYNHGIIDFKNNINYKPEVKENKICNLEVDLITNFDNLCKITLKKNEVENNSNSTFQLDEQPQYCNNVQAIPQAEPFINNTGNNIFNEPHIMYQNVNPPNFNFTKMTDNGSSIPVIKNTEQTEEVTKPNAFSRFANFNKLNK